MNPRYSFGTCCGVRNNDADCFADASQGVCRAIDVRRLKLKVGWGRISDHERQVQIFVTR